MANSETHRIFELEAWGSYPDVLGAFMNGFVRETSFTVTPTPPATSVAANTDVATGATFVMSTDTPLSLGVADTATGIGFGPSDISIPANGGNIRVTAALPAGTYTLRWIRRQA